MSPPPAAASAGVGGSSLDGLRDDADDGADADGDEVVRPDAWADNGVVADVLAGVSEEFVAVAAGVGGAWRAGVSVGNGARFVVIVGAVDSGSVGICVGGGGGKSDESTAAFSTEIICGAGRDMKR